MCRFTCGSPNELFRPCCPADGDNAGGDSAGGNLSAAAAAALEGEAACPKAALLIYGVFDFAEMLKATPSRIQDKIAAKKEKHALNHQKDKKHQKERDEDTPDTADSFQTCVNPMPVQCSNESVEFCGGSPPHTLSPLHLFMNPIRTKFAMLCP